MRALLAGFVAHLQRLGRDTAANVAVTFSLVAPVGIGIGGLALDYATSAAERSRMQAVADGAAVAAAREFQMAQSKPEQIAAIARNYALSQIKDAAVTAQVDAKALKVRVDLTKTITGTLSRLISAGGMDVYVTATAAMSSGLPLCMLALEPKSRAAVTLRTNARMTAPACIVQSNSTSPQGMISMDDAVLQAGFICSAGGKVKTRNTNYTPDPITDCPVMPDPLAARQAPADANCTATGKVIDGTVTSLQPGTYCGGLTVTNGAQVTLYPGTYVFKDGPLLVGGSATLKGTEVTITMKGAGANLTFETASTISLTAPKSGALAGILIFDDPTGAPAPDKTNKRPKEGKSPREHLILSDNARMLLGTIYMPKGRLIVDATKPVADRSAYTVMVVQQLDLYDGPNLYLNTDYANSDVPVPQGVGPYGGKVALTN